MSRYRYEKIKNNLLNSMLILRKFYGSMCEIQLKDNIKFIL